MDARGDCIRVVHPLFQEEGSGSIPTSPLQLHIGDIHMRRGQRLNELWHSLLPDTHLNNLNGGFHSVCYAAEFDGKFYAVAMWSDPIAGHKLKDSKRAIELRRFAIAPDAPKNTASRMLRVMVSLIGRRWPEITRFISYQACAVHSGAIYKASGWVPTARSNAPKWHPRESRAAQQTESDKVRWELDKKPNV